MSRAPLLLTLLSTLAACAPDALQAPQVPAGSSQAPPTQTAPRASLREDSTASEAPAVVEELPAAPPFAHLPKCDFDNLTSEILWQLPDTSLRFAISIDATGHTESLDPLPQPPEVPQVPQRVVGAVVECLQKAEFEPPGSPGRFLATVKFNPQSAR